MSATELRQLWEYYNRSQGTHNINCGVMRRIGKTQCIKQMINERYNVGDVSCVLVPNRSVGDGYRDLGDACRIINVGSDYLRSLRSNPRLQYFADEVPNAEEICMRDNLNFVAGFYSDFSSLQQPQPPPNTRYNTGDFLHQHNRLQQRMGDDRHVVVDYDEWVLMRDILNNDRNLMEYIRIRQRQAQRVVEPMSEGALPTYRMPEEFPDLANAPLVNITAVAKKPVKKIKTTVKVKRKNKPPKNNKMNFIRGKHES